MELDPKQITNGIKHSSDMFGEGFSDD